MYSPHRSGKKPVAVKLIYLSRKPLPPIQHTLPLFVAGPTMTTRLSFFGDTHSQANPQAESPIRTCFGLDQERESFTDISLRDSGSGTFPSTSELQSDPILHNLPNFNDDNLAHDSPVARAANNDPFQFPDNMIKLEQLARSDDGRSQTSESRTSQTFPSWAHSDCWCPGPIHYDSDDEDDPMEIMNNDDNNDVSMTIAEQNSLLSLTQQQQDHQNMQMQNNMYQNNMHQQNMFQQRRNSTGFTGSSRNTMDIKPKLKRRKSAATIEAKGFWGACCGTKRKGTPPAHQYSTRSMNRPKNNANGMDMDD